MALHYNNKNSGTPYFVQEFLELLFGIASGEIVTPDEYKKFSQERNGRILIQEPKLRPSEAASGT
jgi:hypothetical protein